MTETMRMVEVSQCLKSTECLIRRFGAFQPVMSLTCAIVCLERLLGRPR